MSDNPKYLPADERRAVTVEAVVDLAGQQNPSDITTAAIAKHMHLTQGALFRHFPSKDAIWEAVMGWVAERLLSRIDRAAEGLDATPLEAMRAMFMSHVDFVVEHPGVPRMMFGELQRTESTPAKRICRRIEQGKANGDITPDVVTQAAALLFIGTVQGLVMQSLLSGDIGLMRTQAPAVFDIYVRGMKGSR